MIRWEGRTREQVCLVLIFGPPCFGASAVVLWCLAVLKWPAIGRDYGIGPVYWAALAAALVTALGVLLLPGRGSIRVVAALVVLIVAYVCYGFAYIALMTMTAGLA